MISDDEWKWQRLEQDRVADNTVTYAMRVPGGYIIRVRSVAREGRGPNYLEHPIPASEAMVFVPEI